ncbi:hypothetical protein PO909_004674, partial [Leuciscus waleckii]
SNVSPNLFPEHTVFPVIDILTPLIPNGPLVPLHCVVTGVESSQIHMSWAVDRRKEKGQAILTHRNDGGIQITRNQILITAEEWDRKVKCVCVVKFRGQLYTKTLQRHDASNVCYAVKYIYLSLCLIFGLLFLITVIVYVYKLGRKIFVMMCLCKNLSSCSV